MLLFGILKTFVYVLIIYNKDFGNYSEAVDKPSTPKTTPSTPSVTPAKPAAGTPTARSGGVSTPTVKTETQSDGSIIVSTESAPKVEPGVEEVSKFSKDVEEILSKIQMALIQDNGDPRYIEPSDYELLKFHKELFVFVFKQGVKCLGFKHGDQMVWRYDPNKNQGQYPKSIIYKPDSLLYVNFAPKHNMYKYDTDSEQWKLSTDESYTGSGLLAEMDHPNYLNIFTSENLFGTVFKKNDTTKYKIYGHSNRAFLYVFNSDVVCREFRFKDNNVVWRYDATKHGSKYPRSVSVDMSTSMAHFEFTDKVESVKLSEDSLIQYPTAAGITYYTETELKSLGLSTQVRGQGQQSTPTGPILVILDLNTKMDTSRYNYVEDQDLNTETYTAKPGYKFERIIRGNREIWGATNKRYYTNVKLSVDALGEVKIIISDTDQETITISEKPKSVTTPAKGEDEESTPTPTPVTPSAPSVTPSAVPAEAEVTTPTTPTVSEDAKPSTPAKAEVEDAKPSAVPEAEETTPVTPSVPSTKTEDSVPSTPSTPSVPSTKTEDTTPTPSTTVEGAAPSVPSAPSTVPEAKKAEEGEDTTPSTVPEAKKGKDEDKIPELKDKKPTLLDINKSESTQEVEFSKNEADDVNVYTAKAGYVFNIAKWKERHWYTCWLYKHTDDSWETKEEKEYATKVILKGTGGYPKYLLTLPVVGDFVLYYKDKKNADWRDITSLRLSFSDFRFFGSEKAGSGVRELYHKHYDKSVHKFMFGYLFKKGVECSQIKYKDMTLWNYNKSKNVKKPYPIGLYYEMSNKNLYLLFPGDIREMLRIPTTIHRSKLMLSVTTPTMIDFSNRKPVVLDIEKSSSTEHMEYTKDAADDIRIYKAKKGYLFDKVVQTKTVGSDENVWHTDYKNEYSWRVILKGSGDKPKYLLMLPAVGDYMLYYQQKKDDPWKDVTSLALSFSDLRFFGTEKDGSDLKQFDYTFYERATLKFMFGYQFKDGVKCSKIMYKDEVVWTHGTGKPYPLGLYYDFANKNLYLLLPGNKLEILNIPVRHHLVLGSYISSAVQIIAETPAIDPLVMILPSVTIFTYGSTQPNDRTKYELTVAVDIATFEFKDDAECTEVVYRGETVWKHDSANHKQNYPKFVTVYLRTATVMVSFRDDYLYVYKNFNKEWLTLFSGKPHAIQLDIKNQSSCEEYEFKKDLTVGTFTSKDNVVFQEVIRPKSKCSCGSDHVLHKAENFSQYAYKVVIDGLGDKGKKIRLHLLNGRVLTVHMLTENCKSKGYCPYDVPIIRVVTRDSAVPNDTSKYDIFTSDDNKNYVFKPEEMCTKLLVDETVVWAHGPRKPYPKSVSYDKRSQMFVLSYEHEDVIFRREGFGWLKEVVRTSSLAPIEEFITKSPAYSKFPPVPVELNIKKTESGKYMEYLGGGDLTVYTAKPGYVFSKIVKKTRTWYTSWLSTKTKNVWDAPSPSHYATKVILKGSGDKPKHMLMLPVDGDYMLYYQDKKDDPWKDITSLALSFSDLRFYGPDKFGSGVRELYHKHYDKSTRNFMFGYQFKDNVKCSQIKYKDEVVWTHGTGKPYPYGLYYDMAGKELYVQYPGPKWEKQRVHIDAKVATPATVSEDTTPTTPSAKVEDLTSLLTIPKHKSKDDHEELDYGQKFSVYEIKIVTQGSKRANDTTKYERKEEGGIVSYKFNNDAKCTHVGYEYQLVWKHDPDKHQQVYPHTVMVFVRTKVMFVIFEEDFVYVYKYLNNKWHSLFSGKPDPIQLDIKSKNTTGQYSYFYDSNIKTGTYVAKGSVVFKEVIRKKPSCTCGSDTFLLQADKHRNSAYKVVIDGVGDKKKKVWLYLLNGEILHLCKKTGSCGKVEGWVSCKPDIKIVTYGSFDANDTTKYDLKEENDVIKYMFKDSGRCTDIMFDDKTVWSHEDNDTYPRSIIYGNDKKSFLLTFGDQNVVYKKQHDRWSPGLIDLDIKKTKSTEFFAYAKDERDGLRIYTAKPGYIFSKIVKNGCCYDTCWTSNCCKSGCCKSDCCKSECCGSKCCDSECCKNDSEEDPQPGCCLFNWMGCQSECYNQHIIWKSGTYNNNAWRIVLKGSGDSPEYMLMLPVDGDFMLYQQQGGGYKNITTDRLSFLDFTFFTPDKSGYRVREIGYDNYYKSTFKFMFGYQFKDGVKCSKIMYKRETMWIHGDPSKPYPLGLYYDLVNKNLYLLLPGPEWEKLKIPTPSAVPAEVEDATPSVPSTVPEAKKAEEGEDTTPSTVSAEAEGTTPTPSTTVTTPAEAEETAPSAVPEAEETTPAVPSTLPETEVTTPTTPTVSEDAKPIIHKPVEDTKPKVTIQRGTPSCPTIKPKVEDKAKPSLPPVAPTVPEPTVVVTEIVEQFLPKVKIVVLGSDGTADSIGSDDYLLLDSPNILALFVFSDKVTSVEIKHDKHSLWKRKRTKNKDLFPKSLVFKPDGYFYIDFNPFYYSYKFNSTANTFVFGDYSSYTWSGLVDPQYHPKYLEVFTVDEPNNRLKFNDTTQYKLYSYSNRMLLYVFKSEAKCYEFRFKNDVVWRYNNEHPNRYPRSISVDLSTSMAHFEFTDKVESFELSKDNLIQYRLKSDVMLFSEMMRNKELSKIQASEDTTASSDEDSEGAEQSTSSGEDESEGNTADISAEDESEGNTADISAEDESDEGTSGEPGSHQPDGLASGTPPVPSEEPEKPAEDTEPVTPAKAEGDDGTSSS